MGTARQQALAGLEGPSTPPPTSLQPSPPRCPQAPGAKVGVGESPTHLILGQEDSSCPSRHGPQELQCGHARPSWAWEGRAAGGRAPRELGCCFDAAQPSQDCSCHRQVEEPQKGTRAQVQPLPTQARPPGMLPRSSPPPTQPRGRRGLALASVTPAKTLTSEQTYLLGATSQSATVCPVAPKTSRLSRVGRCHGNLLTNPWQPCVHSGLCRRDCELAHPRRGSGQPCIRGARGAPAAAPLSTRVLCHLAPGRPVPGLALEPLQMGELGSPREDHMERRPRQCLTEKQRKWGTL